MSLSRTTSRISLWLAILGAALITACGGGSDGNPSNPYDEPMYVSPSAGTTYAGQPYSINIDNGQAPFSVFSNYPAVIPSVHTDSSYVTLFANAVSENTEVQLTIMDKNGKYAYAGVTVVPTMLYPTSVVVTAVSGDCGAGSSESSSEGYTQVCAGGLGVAEVQLTSNGTAALAGRTVKFEVIEGDFRIQSTNPGSPWQIAVSEVTDELGYARVGIQATAGARTQVAKIRATEVATGNYVNTTFIIIGAQFTISPSTAITWTSSSTTCPSQRVTFYAYGGTPPYAVSFNPSGNGTLSSNTIASSGGSVVLTTSGCFTSGSFTARDATGASLSTSVSYTATGTDNTTAPLAMTPLGSWGTSAARVSCAVGKVLNFTITGGDSSSYGAAISTTGTSPAATPTITTSGSAGTFSFDATTAPTVAQDYSVYVFDAKGATTNRTLYCQP